MLYVWTSAVAKISIALALLRLTVKRCHRMILWCTMILTVSIGLMFWLLLLFDCRPISYFWRQVDHTSTGKCLSKAVLLNAAYVYSSLTIVCDLTLGILPAFLVWKLQMNRRTKFAVGGIFSLGALYAISSHVSSCQGSYWLFTALAWQWPVGSHFCDFIPIKTFFVCWQSIAPW